MAQAVQLTSMPSTFPAGTTVAYTKSVTGYLPSGGWTLTLYFAGKELLAPVVATASGDKFVVTIPAASTAPLDAGTYQWEERVSNVGGEKYTVDSGAVDVSANIESAIAGSLASFAEQRLAEVEAAIATRLSGGMMESYQIAGRAATLFSLDKLYAMRADLRAEVHREKNPGTFTTPVRVAFTGTGNEAP
jgi:hypothetical protein